MKHCFLDRDGVFNYDYPYVGSLDRFIWHPLILPILSTLSSSGYKLVLITNQSGIGRKYYSFSDFLEISFHMFHVLSFFDLSLEINYCPHHPSLGCDCRKPSPGLINRYQVSPDDIFIGNTSVDMLAAINANINNRWIISTSYCPEATKSFTSHRQLLDFLKHDQLFRC